MSKDTEIDMKDVELNELDPEKQPMTGDGQANGGEENGSVIVKQKFPELDFVHAGMYKEELLKVAGTPGWVRTRWVLLILFWVGWIGILAGAIVIIVQAPRCKPTPEMNWWNEGPLYQVSDVEAFSDGLKGVVRKLENLYELKVKGLVLGPLHTVQADQPLTLNLKEITPAQGTQEAFISVVKRAHRNGIALVLDLTPNYLGTAPWFNTGVDNVMEKVKAAAEYWLNLGVAGIKISDLGVASSSADWSQLQAVVQGNLTKDDKKRLLMGVVEGARAAEVSELINTTGVLVLSDLLSSENGGVQRIEAMDSLSSQQRSLGWGLGATQRDRLSKWATTPSLLRLYQLLLFTMPGTPVFNYGDEIGLQAGSGSESPKMVWDTDKGPVVNETVKTERASLRKWFTSLSALRGKQRSLLHGDYYPLYSSASSLSFLRAWDQSERFITAVNWGAAPETITFTLAPTEEVELPETAKVRLSTDKDLKERTSVNLDKLELKPGQAVLLQFSYSG